MLLNTEIFSKDQKLLKIENKLYYSMYICLESMLQCTNDVGWNSSKGRSINVSAKTLTLLG